MYFKLFIAIWLHYVFVQSVPIKMGASIAEINHGIDARKWLHKYGYTSSYNPNIPVKDLIKTIERMQKFAGIPITGEFDDITLKQMSLDRCGREDPYITVKRSKRYIHQGSNWIQLFDKTRKMELKWTLKNTGRTLSYKIALDIMRQAFGYWHDKTNIDFIEIPLSKVGSSDEYNEENIEILVSFESFDHGDGFAFDGQGGTLAHAFYPLNNKGYSGDVHFDDAEDYTYKSPHGRNLLWVATHELGHSLGLAHSNVREAVMYPWYTTYKPGFKLNYDDILGIQTLYGSRTKPMPGAKTTSTTKSSTAPPKTTPTTASTTTTTPTNPPTTATTTSTTTTTSKPYSRQCPHKGDITAVYYSERYRQFFAFTKTDNLYLLGYPSTIPVIERSNYLPKSIIGEQINAALLMQIDGETRVVYFAGSKYYVYKNGFEFKSGGHSIYDKSGPLGVEFPSDPKQPYYVKTIDTAFTWQKNGKIYFFSDKYYWRYDSTKKTFDAGYPKKISVAWRGLPAQIDAAYSSKETKETIFISGDQYYIYDDVKINVTSQHPINRFLKCNV